MGLIDVEPGLDAPEWVGGSGVGATPATLVPDDDGMVHFTNLPEGKYRAEFGASNIEFEVVAGTTTEKALTLLGG